MKHGICLPDSRLSFTSQCIYKATQECDRFSFVTTRTSVLNKPVRTIALTPRIFPWPSRTLLSENFLHVFEYNIVENFYFPPSRFPSQFATLTTHAQPRLRILNSEEKTPGLYSWVNLPNMWV